MRAFEMAHKDECCPATGRMQLTAGRAHWGPNVYK